MYGTIGTGVAENGDGNCTHQSSVLLKSSTLRAVSVVESR